jgi:glycosyltransferase involved in cell wall biosynthesis
MISVVMPTKGRPEQARACVERLLDTSSGQEVEVIVVADAGDFDARGLEKNVGVIRPPDEPGPIPAWNHGLAFAHGEWIVTGADDLVWCDGWLAAALASARDGFCGLYDGHTEPSERATHFLLSRAYIETHQGGHLMPPYYRSWYPDAEISAIAQRVGAYVCPAAARVEHHHPDWRDAPDDATYQAGRKHHNADRRIFYRRKRFGFPNEAVPWGDDVRAIIGVPIERAISYADEVFWAFISIAQQGWPFIKLPYTRIDVARNKFAMHMLNSDFTHLVMLDVDHEHHANVVKRLVRRVEEDPARLVVSGLNFRRGQPYEPIAFVCRDQATYSVADWAPGEMIPVDLIGCGCVIISREVFERLPGPPWFWNDYGGAALDNWPGEDIVFSRLCRQKGIELWIDTATSSDHLIDGRVNEAVYRAYMDAHHDEVYVNEELEV